MKRGIKNHNVSLHEPDTMNVFLGANIKDFNRPKAGDMGDKAVHTRAHINVFMGVLFVDALGNDQILVEVGY